MNQKKLRVYAVGNFTDWLFTVREDRMLVGSGFGQLPTCFQFDRDTATLYALAQAYRQLSANFGREGRDWRVVCVCTNERNRTRRNRRRAA